MQSKRILTTKELCLCGLFIASFAVGAFITIPTPFVPFTLQVLFILICSTLLPTKLTCFSIISYILLGLMGLPIFSNQSGGPSSVFMPTFGYLIGFLLAGIFISNILKSKEKTFLNVFVTCLIGVIIIYAFGGTYFYFIMNSYLNKNVTISYVLTNCVIITLPFDILKSLICAFITSKLKSIDL